LRLAQLGGDPHALQAQQPWCSEHGEQRCTRRDEDGTRLPARWCCPVVRLRYIPQGWQLLGRGIG
jgi:hypothetical protein